MVTKPKLLTYQTEDGIVQVVAHKTPADQISYITILVGRETKRLHINQRYLNELIDILVDIYELSKKNGTA